MENYTDLRLKPSPETGYMQVHLKDYLDIIRRRKWLVILFFLTVVGLVSFFSIRATPVYRATTQILIENKASQMIQYGDSSLGSSAAQMDYFQTQLHLLRNGQNAYEVIEALELWKLFEYRTSEESRISTHLIKPVSQFLINLASPLLKKLKSRTHEHLAALDLPTSLPEEGRPDSRISPGMVDWYLASLQITPVRGSSLCNISFIGTSPELITRIVNTHARTFIAGDIQRRKSTAQEALNWVKTQMNAQKTQLETSMQAISEYNKAHDIVSLESRQDITSQELMSLISALSRARADRMAKQAVWDHVKNLSVDDERLFAIPGISQNIVIRELRNQLIKAREEQRDERARVSAEYPRNHQLDARIKQLKQEITLEVERMRRAIKVELDRAVAYEKSIRNDLQKQKLAMRDLSEMAVGNDVLLQQEKINQDMYEILLKQSKEIDLTGQMESSNIRVVDPARVPRYPIKPRIFLNILLAMALGLFLGTGLTFFVEYMDNTPKTPGDVLRRIGVPVMGALPYDKSLKKNKTPALSWDEASAQKGKNSAACALVDASSCVPAVLRPPGEGPAGRVMMIESATVGEGKTTVATHFARNLTRTGLRVLMVDCDFQRPTLHRLFGLPNEGGLAGALSRVTSDKISSGALERFSVADIFFLINLRKQSGRLTIRDKSKAQTMTAFFRDGRFLHLQNHHNPPANLLGNMLLTGGFITENQLQDAIERNKRTGQPLGYLLMNAGYISRDKLNGPLRLQTEENLQKLFSWKEGSFVFGDGKLSTYDTYSRIALSAPLLCKGISGRSKTSSNSDLLLVNSLQNSV